MRIIAACVLALFATSAVAQNLVLNDPIVHYAYTFQTRGPMHFCDFTTAIVKPPLPLFVKLTASYTTDDRKPKDNDVMVAYVVEASSVTKLEPLNTKGIKVVGGRIISDIFNSDLMASKLVDKNFLGASYSIPSEGSLALFTNLLTMHGDYTLAVELENNASLTIVVKPTAEMLEPSKKWMECSLAIMEHRKPQ